MKVYCQSESQSEAISVILGEREYQNRKWGTIAEHPHEVGAYILLMEQFISEARKAWSGNRRDIEALGEIRKVAALGVACLEQHGALARNDRGFLLRADRAP